MRILLLLFCLSAVAVRGQRLEIHAPPQLTAVRIDNMPTVYFELWVKNISKDTLTFESIEINGKTSSWFNYSNIIADGLLLRSNHSPKLGPNFASSGR